MASTVHSVTQEPQLTHFSSSITQQNIINQKVRVALDNGEEVEVGLDEIREESFFERYRKIK